MKLLFLVVLFTVILYTQAFGMGCNSDKDCNNADHVCAKILLGKTPEQKQKQKYYHICLPKEWASTAVKAAEFHDNVLSSKTEKASTGGIVEEEKPEAQQEVLEDKKENNLLEIPGE